VKFTIWNVVGGVISFVFAGPIGLGIFVLGWLVFWYHTTMRGFLFVQSYLYIMLVAEESNRHEASIKANDLKIYEVDRLMVGAVDFSNQFTKGQQLPVIATAKEQGYIHKKKSFFEVMREVWAR